MVPEGKRGTGTGVCERELTLYLGVGGRCMLP
jgi:hypothetical protein